MRPARPSAARPDPERGTSGGGQVKRYTSDRTGVPYVKTTVRIYGERQIETFEAMCAVNGRRPHQMAADIMLDAIREARHDHDIQHVVPPALAAAAWPGDDDEEDGVWGIGDGDD